MLRTLVAGSLLFAAPALAQNEGVRHLLNAAGIEASAIGQASFVERIRSEAARYATIIEQTGIGVER
jgi:hypothetical protein